MAGDMENGIHVRKRDLHTTFGVQASALLRKNLTLQKRSWCMNACLVFFPVILCVLIIVFQALINAALSSNDGLKCGCKCLDETRGEECSKRDNTKCGLLYSDSPYFCENRHPFEMPNLVQLPVQDAVCLNEKAKDLPECAPLENVSVAYTASASNMENAKSIAELLFEPMPTMMTAFLGLVQGKGDGSVFEALSTVVQGSDTGPQIGLQFKEPFLNYPGRPLYLMVNNCSSLSGLAIMPSLSDKKAVNDSESDGEKTDGKSFVLSVPLRSQFVPTAPAGGENLSTEVTLRCLDVILDQVQDAHLINKRLYEGYNGGEQSSLVYDFRKTSSKRFDVNVWFNQTLADFQIGWPKNQLRLPKALNAASNAFIRWVTNRTDAQIPLLYVKDMPKPATTLNIDISSSIGPLFFGWVIQLLLPVTIFNLVYEKEHNLRMMMKMHGLGDSAYWAISYGYFFVISILYTALFVAFGSVVQLNFFIRNDYSVQLVFYFLVVNNMIALAFFVTPFFSSVKTAMVISYLYVFGMGLLGQYVFAIFWEDTTRDPWLTRGLELVPAWAIYRGLLELSAYAAIAKYEGSDGLTWGKMSDRFNGMSDVMYILFAEWFVFLLLALYMDKVVASGSGVRRHPLFFLNFLRKRGAKHGGSDQAPGSAQQLTRQVSVSDSPVPKGKGKGRERAADHDGEEGEDVIQEREAVECARREDSSSGYSILCDNLRKVYPGADGNEDKIAVKGLSLAVRRGECFGMLGPNGAGKTTSINMMIGFLSPTSGQGLIEGLSIEEDMDQIYSMMGVCPQHDLIWESLSAREHLRFFGRLKNLTDGKELEAAVDASLRSVNLYHGGVADKLSGQYSGGMKRRLSVAISLIGNPLVVYMDEPSTGLDPASRNNLWKVVKEAKKDRAIILTTHSMEEAEALCDRIGIIVGGEFRCIGAPKDLTARYGGSFVFTITTPIDEEAGAEQLAASLSPNARKVYGIAGTQKFEMPVAGVDIAAVFGIVEQAKKSLTIRSWGIANTTLEDVFIKIAKGGSKKQGLT